MSTGKRNGAASPGNSQNKKLYSSRGKRILSPPENPFGDTGQGTAGASIDLAEDLNRLQRLAIGALAQVAENKQVSPAARAAAARTILEYTGGVGKHSLPPGHKDSKPLYELSLDEIEKELGQA